MASLGQHFDANAVDPNVGFPLVPPGKYIAHITTSDMRPTKDGTGQYLYLELEILDGPEAGKKLFERLNLINGNETTVRIAQQSLSQICHAVGVMSVSDSEQLHARRMLVDVRTEQGKGAYRDSNRIVSYAAPSGTAAPQQPVRQNPAAPGAQSVVKPAGTTPPWRKSAA
jgi:hypothetical protein